MRQTRNTGIAVTELYLPNACNMCVCVCRPVAALPRLDLMRGPDHVHHRMGSSRVRSVSKCAYLKDSECESQLAYG